MTISTTTAPSDNNFDYIIIGAGLAGLSLAVSLLKNKITGRKRILLLEKSQQQYQGRTWCFWENGADWWDSLVSKTWSIATFYEGTRQLAKELAPMRYKMVHSDDYRRYVFNILRKQQNIHLLSRDVVDCKDLGTTVAVHTEEGLFFAPLVFDSRFQLAELERHKGHILYQQFIGWFIKSEEPIFDPQKACLMDFRATQDTHVSFCYVLPKTAHEALVEFTIFSKQIYSDQYLQALLTTYIDEHIDTFSFNVLGKETGVIPMTDYAFGSPSNRIIPIGTAGGCSKPSSGYTFTFVQQHVKHIVQQLAQDRLPLPFHKLQAKRFLFYDRVMLRILKEFPEKGASLFFSMFHRNNANSMFKFLANQSTLWQEINIFRKLPVLFFLRMAWREIVRDK